MPTTPRTSVPLMIADVSAFAKALRQALTLHAQTSTSPPTHLVLLNHVARAAGYQNFQSLRATTKITPGAPAVKTKTDVDLTALAKKTLSQFDAQGRLLRLPNKLTVQKMAVWCLWTRFSAKRRYTEREINDVLKAYNTFGDHVTLRRELVETGLLQRTPDCAVYRKCAAKPTAETAAMLLAYHAGTHTAERQRPRARSAVAPAAAAVDLH
jgi:hypothetical protein